MEHYIPVLINAAVLVCGGIVDYKKREIPNSVPIVLLLVGSFFDFSPIKSIVSLAVPAALLFLAAKLTGGEVPGGDVKLLCALGYACGLLELAAVIFLAGIGAATYGFIRHLPIKRHIPLCSYVAPAYLTLHVIALVLERGGSM